jgi:NifU-like protein involved in Fe-S cluster formation
MVPVYFWKLHKLLELSTTAREHFDNPRGIGSLTTRASDITAKALVGEPISGDILKLHLQASKQGQVLAAHFKAYGCGWLIACGSLLIEYVEGRKIAEIRHFRHHYLIEKLLCLPSRKLYCAVLAETALKAALRTLPTNFLVNN